MSWPSMLAGAVLLLAILWDFVASTVGTHGQGRFTAWLGERLFTGMAWVNRHTKGDRARRLTGPVILLGIGAFWIFGTWAAWTLIFYGSGTLIITATQEPSDLPGTFTFVGSALSTAGSSEFGTTGFFGNLLTVLAAVQGMTVLTLTVSFILNLSSTVMEGRAFSLATSSARSLDELERSGALQEFRTLCARLHVSPVALYFAPPHGEASLADAVADFAGKVEQAPNATRMEKETVRKGLALLPFAEPDPVHSPTTQRLGDWRHRYGRGLMEG